MTVPSPWSVWDVWERYLAGNGNGGGRGGTGVLVSSGLIAVVAASVTAAVWVQSSIYTTRAGIEAEIRQAVQESESRLRSDTNERLTHYLTIERFLVRENELKDNYNALLGAIDRLAARKNGSG